LYVVVVVRVRERVRWSIVKFILKLIVNFKV
jgi:hypothetical protein